MCFFLLGSANSWFPPPHLSHLASTPDPKDIEKNIWLYDVIHDPEERHDVSETHLEVVRAMLGRLAEYNRTAVTPIWPGQDHLAEPSLRTGVWEPWRP